MTWQLARSLRLGPAACLAAAALAAFNPFSVFMSAQGFQLEFFTFLILAFTDLCVYGRFGATGLAGALLILTRIQAAAAVLPLGIIAALRSGRKLKLTARLLILPALALAVLLVSAKMNTGSFTGNLDHAARFYTAAELNGDPGMTQGSEKMTLGKYLFSRGSLPSLALKTLDGYFQLFCNPFNSFNKIFLNSHDARYWNLLLLPFLWAGLWFFITDGSRRYFLLFPLLFLNGLPALQAQLREPRLLFHAAPFFFILCGAGLAFVAGKARSLTGSKEGPGRTQAGDGPQS
jgi:hypothetical protein